MCQTKSGSKTSRFCKIFHTQLQENAPLDSEQVLGPWASWADCPCSVARSSSGNHQQEQGKGYQ